MINSVDISQQCNKILLSLNKNFSSIISSLKLNNFIVATMASLILAQDERWRYA